MKDPTGAPSASPTLLETAFPALGVSQLAAADRRVKDPAHAAHKWWARRPPAVMRAILIAATLDGNTSEEEFWRMYADPATTLAGLSVYDPFMGGGTTLIEAARLGADVVGTDVDPTSTRIVAHALEPVPAADVLVAGDELLTYLRTNFGDLYPDETGDPLHYFWLHIVTCPRCDQSGPLFRSLVLVRNSGKSGAVVRDDPLTVFDPEEFTIHHLRKHDQVSFMGAARRWRVDRSTFKSSRYGCPHCRKHSTHRELLTGTAPRQLVAVERTRAGERRRLEAASTADLSALEAAKSMLTSPPVPLALPTAKFTEQRSDPRPRSFGIYRVSEVFSTRQLLVLGAAHAWLDQRADMAPGVNRAVRLALSNALITNNRLCSYATDYGRLAPLFSVRGYSLPALSVELNPLHESGGRGTIRKCLNRVARSATSSVRRSIWNMATSNAEARVLELPPEPGAIDLRCSSAADTQLTAAIDLLVFDPPYYDYIVYDELAELFRAWNDRDDQCGQTLQSATDGDGAKFGVALADCLRPAIAARNEGLPIAFTYHSSNPAAWSAIGLALDETKLRITAMWPVRSDVHMGHHSHPGNCEWDIVVVCRPVSETTPATSAAIGSDWERLLGEFDVGRADRTNFQLAHDMAAPRYGSVVADPD